MQKVIDAVVIGAGHAGLAVSQRLAAAGLDHVVLERGEIAETWRTQRWDSFTLNTPNVMNVLPGTTAPATPDVFWTTATWIGQLERYARECKLPVRTHTEVTRLERDDGTFTVSTSTGETIRTRSVVVASGTQNVPKLPALAREIHPSIRILTTATYKRADQLPAGAVLVVGGAQSGCQIAEDLLDAGREAYMSTSKVGRLPRRIRGADAMVRLGAAGWLAQRPEELPDPAVTRWAQPQISGIGPTGHTVSYQSLTARGVTLLGHLEAASGTQLRLADDLTANMRFADERSAAFKKIVDDHLARMGTDVATEPDAADEPVADPSRYTSPSEIDLRDRGISTVIFSTGFTGDLSWLRVPAVDDRGAPVHAEGRSPVGGLWFVGIPWMRSRSSGIIPGAADDSAFVVEGIREQVKSRTMRL
jgi:putative flavoprotein involved in K+ transport